MQQLTDILKVFDNWLWGNWLLFVLLGVGILYTAISGCVQIRYFGYILKKTLWEPIRDSKKILKTMIRFPPSKHCAWQ